MSRADVAARKFIDQSVPTALPVDLEQMAGELGIMVVREDSESPLYGMLIRRDGEHVIGLNSVHTAAGQRFALAHLLGHFKLHCGRDLIIDDVAARHTHRKLPSLPTDREEAEANRFAGALLMPEAVVRTMAAEADFATAAQLVDLLAPPFEVSRAVMGYRLMSLGIILDV